MKFNITIDVTDADLEDVTQAISDKYGYEIMLEDIKTVTIPELLDDDGTVLRGERTQTINIEVPNPENAIDYMGRVILGDLKGRVAKIRRDAVAKAAVDAIDDSSIESNIDVTIS